MTCPTQPEVLRYGEIGKYPPPFGDKSYAHSRDSFCREACQIRTFEQNFSRFWFNQTGYPGKSGALSGAIGSDQCQYLSFSNRKGDRSNGLYLAVANDK